MADMVLIKATMLKNGTLYPPQSQKLEDRELAFHRSEEALYIGDDNGNPIKLCQASDVGRAAEKVAPLESDAALSDVIAKVNEMISALKDGGLMKT